MCARFILLSIFKIHSNIYATSQHDKHSPITIQSHTLSLNYSICFHFVQKKLASHFTRFLNQCNLDWILESWSSSRKKGHERKKVREKPKKEEDNNGIDDHDHYTDDYGSVMIAVGM